MSNYNSSHSPDCNSNIYFYRRPNNLDNQLKTCTHVEQTLFPVTPYHTIIRSSILVLSMGYPVAMVYLDAYRPQGRWPTVFRGSSTRHTTAYTGRILRVDLSIIGPTCVRKPLLYISFHAAPTKGVLCHCRLWWLWAFEIERRCSSEGYARCLNTIKRQVMSNIHKYIDVVRYVYTSWGGGVLVRHLNVLFHVMKLGIHYPVEYSFGVHWISIHEYEQ